jgi:hypothetical protein
VVEAEYLLHEISHEHTDHPDLLVLHEADRSLVEAVLAECRGEGGFYFVNISLMELDHFILVVFVDQSGGLLGRQENRGELVKVSLEKSLKFFEERDAIEKGLFKVGISFFDILKITLLVNVEDS